MLSFTRTRNAMIGALLGLGLVAIGLVRGGTLPVVIGVGLLGLAAMRAWSVWRNRATTRTADRPPATSEPSEPSTGQLSPRPAAISVAAGNQSLAARSEAARGLRVLGPSLLFNLLVPIVVYSLVRPSVDSDTTALAIGAAIPVLRTVGLLVVRRRVDLLGVLVVAGFGFTLVATWLMGGNPFFLKVHPESILTGVIGVVLLGSAAIGRPLLPAALRLLARGDPERTRRLELTAGNPERGRLMTVATVIIGLTLLVHAAALLALALTLPTSSYLVISRVVSWAILGAGGVVTFWYARGRGREPSKPTVSG